MNFEIYKSTRKKRVGKEVTANEWLSQIFKGRKIFGQW